jgi:hypothetical protein
MNSITLSNTEKSIIGGSVLLLRAIEGGHAEELVARLARRVFHVAARQGGPREASLPFAVGWVMGPDDYLHAAQATAALDAMGQAAQDVSLEQLPVPAIVH